MVHETTFSDFLYNYRMKHEIYNDITHKQKKVTCKKNIKLHPSWSSRKFTPHQIKDLTSSEQQASF